MPNFNNFITQFLIAIHNTLLQLFVLIFNVFDGEELEEFVLASVAIFLGLVWLRYHQWVFNTVGLPLQTRPNQPDEL